MLSICSTLIPAYTNLRDVFKTLTDTLTRYETSGSEADKQVFIQALADTEQAFANLEGKLMFADRVARLDKVPVALGDLLATEFLCFGFTQRKISLGHFRCYSENGRVTQLSFKNLVLGSTFDYSPITHLTALRDLSLSINDLKRVPEDLPESLVFLYADHNEITKLPDFSRGFRFQRLHFSYNDITNLPECFKEPEFIKSLVSLDLRYNPLTPEAIDVLYAARQINPAANILFDGN